MQPGCSGVPDRDRCNPVEVHVFWCLLQLGEDGQEVPRLGETRLIDLEHDRAIALHDQRRWTRTSGRCWNSQG